MSAEFTLIIDEDGHQPQFKSRTVNNQRAQMGVVNRLNQGPMAGTGFNRSSSPEGGLLDADSGMALGFSGASPLSLSPRSVQRHFEQRQRYQSGRGNGRRNDGSQNSQNNQKFRKRTSQGGGGGQGAPGYPQGGAGGRSYNNAGKQSQGGGDAPMTTGGINLPGRSNLGESGRVNPAHMSHLDLNIFKTKPCRNEQQHNPKHCMFYHSMKDRKRLGTNYHHELCQKIDPETGCCPLKDQCPKAHNMVEQLYHPDKYKTKFCSFYPKNIKNCDYGSFCSFAHNEEDIKIELIHRMKRDPDFYMYYYKTVWCPFNTPHDKATCVYAHNWQDFRRKPRLYQYDNTSCPDWKSDNFIFAYEDGCPNHAACTKCHGWKEQEYHPRSYKTRPCTSTKGCKGDDCPYYHNESERRVVGSIEYNMGLMPKNRSSEMAIGTNFGNGKSTKKHPSARFMDPETFQRSISNEHSPKYMGRSPLGFGFDGGQVLDRIFSPSSYSPLADRSKQVYDANSAAALRELNDFSLDSSNPHGAGASMWKNRAGSDAESLAIGSGGTMSTRTSPSDHLIGSAMGRDPGLKIGSAEAGYSYLNQQLSSDDPILSPSVSKERRLSGTSSPLQGEGYYKEPNVSSPSYQEYQNKRLQTFLKRIALERFLGDFVALNMSFDQIISMREEDLARMRIPQPDIAKLMNAFRDENEDKRSEDDIFNAIDRVTDVSRGNQGEATDFEMVFDKLEEMNLASGNGGYQHS